MDKPAQPSCVDCKSTPSCVTVRKRDFCEQCFVKFLRSKVSKRMNRYRLRNTVEDHRRILLLPLSYGVSSLTLLNIISGLLDKQATGGQKRTAFDLHVLAVISGTANTSNGAEISSKLETVTNAYPRNTYTEIPLHSIFQYDSNFKNDISSYITDPSGSAFNNDEKALALFRASFSTPTARADLDRILRRRLIVEFARSNNCEAILWGDSDSRLAAKTLANVANGRGSSLIWDTCDGMSPWDLYFNFPLRDLYKTEIDLYASFTLESVRSVIEPDAHDIELMSTRQMSIDDLMSHYVLTQGAKYPGVMANIVRTVDKLKTPAIRGGDACFLCRAPIAPSLSKQNNYDSPNANETRPACYGCMRSLLDLRATSFQSGASFSS